MAMDWIRNPRTQKVLKISGMSLFGVVVFVVSIGFTLPSDRLKSFIESKAAQAGMSLSISDVSAGGFGRITLDGVSLSLPPSVIVAPDGTRTETPRKVELDRLVVKVGLFSTLFGSPSLKVTARNGEGWLGPVRIKLIDKTVDVTIDEIVDFPLPAGLSAGPLSLAGLIRSGSGHMLWDLEAGLSGSEGQFEINATNLVAKDPVLNTKQAGAIALTDISMGSLEASIIIDKRSSIGALKQGRRGAGGADSRVVYFEKLKIDGKDISAMVEGNSVIRLMAGRNISKSQITVELAFAVSDAFFDKKAKGSDEQPNRFLKTLLEMDPRWKSARSGRFYGLVCTGTLADPNCMPRRPGVSEDDFKAMDDSAPEADQEEKPAAKKPVTRTRTVPKRTVQSRTSTTDRAATGQDDSRNEPAERTDQVVPQQEGNEEDSTGSESGRGVNLIPAVSNVGTPSRVVRPSNAVQPARTIGGKFMEDNSVGVRPMDRAGMRANVRLQEPGEPSEE